MTSPNCASGSDRVREVARQIEADIYVNIQGDEPTLTPEFFPPLLGLFDRPEVQVATLAVRCPADDIDNPECGEGGDGAGWEGAVFFAGDDSARSRSGGICGLSQAPGDLRVSEGCAGKVCRACRRVGWRPWRSWSSCGCWKRESISTWRVLRRTRLAWIQKRICRGRKRC